MKVEEESQRGSENPHEAPGQQAMSPLEGHGSKSSISLLHYQCPLFPVTMIAATIKAFQILLVQEGIVTVIPL